MADYFPLLSRALDALPDRSPALRHAVYERARGALVGQLRTLDPPLSEADIDHERRQLDGAIARLEAIHEPDPVEPDEIPEEATLPAGPPLDVRSPSPRPPPDTRPPQEARPPLLPEPGPPETPLALLPPRREALRPAEAGEGAAPSEEAVKRPRLKVRRPRDTAATLRKTAGVAALTLVVALIAVAAWLLRDKPSDLPVVGAEGIGRIEDGDAKFAERVGGERAGAAGPAASAPAAPGTSAGPASSTPRPSAEPAAAPRGILYEEDPTNPQAPRALQGRASWRLDAVNAGQGQPLETVIRGTVEVPEAGLTLALILRRNTDASLPASHTIELAFTTNGAAGSARAVREMGVPQLKAEESARGAPLAGLPVPVRDNLFLIGLSNPPADLERNTDLLLRRSWFDLPLRYAAGGRAVLSFEKGSAGERAFADAFAQWR